MCLCSAATQASPLVQRAYGMQVYELRLNRRGITQPVPVLGSDDLARAANGAWLNDNLMDGGLAQDLAGRRDVLILPAQLSATLCVWSPDLAKAAEFLPPGTDILAYKWLVLSVHVPGKMHWSGLVARLGEGECILRTDSLANRHHHGKLICRNFRQLLRYVAKRGGAAAASLSEQDRTAIAERAAGRRFTRATMPDALVEGPQQKNYHTCGPRTLIHIPQLIDADAFVARLGDGTLVAQRGPAGSGTALGELPCSEEDALQRRERLARGVLRRLVEAYTESVGADAASEEARVRWLQMRLADKSVMLLKYLEEKGKLSEEEMCEVLADEERRRSAPDDDDDDDDDPSSGTAALPIYICDSDDEKDKPAAGARAQVGVASSG